MLQNIVVIEDNDIIRENMVDILTLHSFNTFAYSDGNIALQEIKKIKPDLILCDIMMPALPGYKVLESLKSDVNTSTIPFIFITSKSEKNDIRMGMDLGANDYLTKPFTIKELMGTVNARLERAAQEKINQTQKLDDLSHIISHEYNTPLNGILGLSELLVNAQHNVSKEEVIAYLQSINQAGKRLKETNERLLNFIHIEKIATNKNSNTVSIKKALAYIDEITVTIAARHKRELSHKITYSINNQELQILNSDCFFIVVTELLDNCFRYAPNHSLIEIDLIESGNRLQLKTINTGNLDLEVATSEAGLKKYFATKNGFGIGLYMIEKINKILNLDFYILQKNCDIEAAIKFYIM